MIACTAVCALAVATLVYGEIKNDARLRIRAKPIASLAFLAVAVIASDFEAPIALRDRRRRRGSASSATSR